MPVNFDFENAGPLVVAGGTNPGPVTNVDTDSVSGTTNVRFTVNTDAPGGIEDIRFGNANGTTGLRLNDNGAGPGAAGNDVWTLRFQDTANAAFTVLSGTAGNPVALRIGNMVNNGVVQVEFLTTGGGVAAATTASGDLQTLFTTIPGNKSFTFSTIAPNISGVRFTSTSTFQDTIVLESLSANDLNCFLTGTRIATPKGEVAVEDLKAGDTVLTAEGKETEVKWLGRQNIDTRLVHPSTANPICITAGAIAENVPARDLFVTGDHAIAIDGLLINASALVNDSSIYRVRHMPIEGFSYYHIETEAHELLLAEGCPAESFIDCVSTDSFENYADRPDRVIPEMDLPRILAARHVPAPLRTRLIARAETTQELPIAV